MEYKYIWAWHKLSGSFDYYIINLVNKAKADGAPETAIYYDNIEKRWHTVEEVQNERRIKDMENWIAAHNRPSEAEMRDYLKANDPHFATDDYLDSLSHDELCEYYRECKATEIPVGDDWCHRLECVKTNNM